MWTVALSFFMVGLFFLGFVFGVFFGIWVADKLRDELGRAVGKPGKKRFG